jgi:hypothetical protein
MKEDVKQRTANKQDSVRSTLSGDEAPLNF